MKWTLNDLRIDLLIRGGCQTKIMELETEKEIKWLDWVADTTGHPYVSAVVSREAYREGRYAVDRQRDVSLDELVMIWRPDNGQARSGV